jgi:hypothetical protein
MRVGVSSRSGQAFILAAIIFVCGCSRRAEEMPVIPSTPPLSRSVIGYVVVSSSYTHIQNEPAPESVSLGYLRRGSSAEILERRIIHTRGVSETWIKVNGAYRGWIKEEGVQIYDTEAQARTASESLSRGPELHGPGGR